MTNFDLYNNINDVVINNNPTGIKMLIERAKEREIPTDIVLSNIYTTIVSCVSTYLSGLSKYELIENDDKIDIVPISLKKALKMELKRYNDIYVSNNCLNEIEALFEAHNNSYETTWEWTCLYIIVYEIYWQIRRPTRTRTI